IPGAPRMPGMLAADTSTGGAINASTAAFTGSGPGAVGGTDDGPVGAGAAGAGLAATGAGATGSADGAPGRPGPPAGGSPAAAGFTGAGPGAVGGTDGGPVGAGAAGAGLAATGAGATGSADGDAGATGSADGGSAAAAGSGVVGGGVDVTLPDGSVATAPNEQAAGAVRNALSQQGVPYVWGGTTPGQGLDCSGLTQWAYGDAGVEIPRLAQEQDVGAQVAQSDLMPGDLAVWDGHVAMYIGNDQLVEAGDPVSVSGLRTDNIGMAFQGFYRPTGG